MPVAFVQEFPIEDRSTTNYDEVTERLNTERDWPDGGIFHTAGFDDDAGVFRIFEVWETREQSERFINERVMPLVQQMLQDGAPPPSRQTWYELHGFAAKP
jgi:hypothetical protein